MFDSRQTKKEIIEGGMKLHALYVETYAENERLRAKLVSIGILNASGPHPDPEIDKVIREVA